MRDKNATEQAILAAVEPLLEDILALQEEVAALREELRRACAEDRVRHLPVARAVS